MTKDTNTAERKSRRGEKGQALIMVLMLLAASSLIVKPLVDNAGTSLKTGQVYERKEDELYAADAGIEDARWQIKYDHLGALFPNPAYDSYDYSTNWSYVLSERVNDKTTNITISNVWIPNTAVPSKSQARTVIQDGKLIVTGAVPSAGTYRIKLTYYAGAGENLTVQKLGIWLPPGYTYVNGSSNLEASGKPYTSVPVVSAHAGGLYVIWTFASVRFSVFPGVDTAAAPQTSEVTFQFGSAPLAPDPDAVAWITTGGVASIPFAWDDSIKVYKMLSVAAGTTVESYIAKNDPRELSTGFAGDYKAAGNSLMRDTDHDGKLRETLLAESSSTVNDIPVDATVKAAYLYWSARRVSVFLDELPNLNTSNWTVASPTAWSASSGKLRGHYGGSGGDPTRLLAKKTDLNLSSFAPGTVTISWTQSIGGILTANDGLNFSFSGDGGVTWGANITAYRGPTSPPATFSYVVPDAYLTNKFRVRFYVVGMAGSGQYYYLDNIVVMSSDKSVVFKIDGQQVYFDGDGDPQQGAQELTAGSIQVLPNYINGGGIDGSSFVSFRDVTTLVKTYSDKAPDPALNHPGNASYTVGGVAGDPGSELSYAGWSIVIVYSSPETLGHSLHLYDSFMHSGGNMDVDFDKDGQPGGTISGFIVPDQISGEVDAAKITCFIGEGDLVYAGDFLAFNAPESYRANPSTIPNSYKLWDGTTTASNSASTPGNVWNSASVGLAADGVDIDTFHVTWSSHLLVSGDTSARLDVPTQTDEWNLIYIILSFRSEASTRGVLSYIIR